MKVLEIPDRAVREWNAYEEAGALVLGVRCAPQMQIESIIFQIDLEGSDQRQECMGMYAELDEIGRYAVRKFAYDPSQRRLDVAFAANAFPDVASMVVQLPSGKRVQEDLVRRMAEVFRDYPARAG